ncbi:miaB-like tRNA modifying enzyme, partial [Candidatus Termititenax persephonae]
TDIIVGFPGETRETFQETCDFIQETGFHDLHIFPYSPRPQTAAAQMPNICPDKLVKQFTARLATLRQKMKNHFLQKYLTLPLAVLVENNKGTGFSSEYIAVKLSGNIESGKFYTAVPLGIKDGVILANPAHGITDANLHRQII